MAKKPSAGRGSEGGGRTVIQRRPARVRQLRRSKEVAQIAAPTAAAKPAKGRPFARAVSRQLRGVKQQRAAGLRTSDTLVIARPKVVVARRLQPRQLSTPKISVRPLTTATLARPVIIVPKVDRRRVAQVSQKALRKVSARARISAK